MFGDPKNDDRPYGDAVRQISLFSEALELLSVEFGISLNNCTAQWICPAKIFYLEVNDAQQIITDGRCAMAEKWPGAGAMWRIHGATFSLSINRKTRTLEEFSLYQRRYAQEIKELNITIAGRSEFKPSRAEVFFL